jgi:thiol-disulfide isomerase/thioredoxin
MTATPSTMLPLGTPLPSFVLPGFDGRAVSSVDFDRAPGLLVAFICRHCPFVLHIRSEFARFAREYQARGLAIVAINANDVEAFPQDAPDGMREEAREAGYVFPYLFDESQAAADAVLTFADVSVTQRASIGCNIKWKPGNEPEYL